MIKAFFFHAYEEHLQKKWNMSSAGASILTNSFIKDYRNRSNHNCSLSTIHTAHKNGFAVNDWIIMGLNKQKCKKYISNAQYVAKHPFNGKYSKWIDDKLTLKYICSGTTLDKYMPQYYFMIDARGQVMQLMDCPDSVTSKSIDGILKLLREKKVLAVKKISGSLGDGFYKIEYHDGKYILNGNILNEDDMKNNLIRLKNYLIIEYLYPHEQFAEYCPNTCSCLRYLVGRIDGNLTFIKSYIRFGAVQSGFIDNYNAGGVLCYVDRDGYYSSGNIMDMQNKTNIKIYEHPDSKKKLEGRIPLWNKILEMVDNIDRLFPQLNYLGIDVVITSEHQVKMLEINSLTSLDGLQLLEPIDDIKIKEFLSHR